MLYEGLLWIGLENALYEKERQTRPALYDLRLSMRKRALQESIKTGSIRGLI